MAFDYTDEELIEHFRKFGEELGKAPSQSDVNKRRLTDKNFPSTPVFSRRFGFTKLAEICEFNLNRKIYTEKELLDILKDYFNKFGIPTQDDFDNNSKLPSSYTYIKYFGGIRKALIQMNLIEETHYSTYQNHSDEDILTLIKEFYLTNGSINSSNFDSKNNLPTSGFLRRRFGSLKNIYDKCNIPYSDIYFSEYKNYSKRELLDKLIWFNGNVSFPTNRAISSHENMPAHNLYYNQFGSVRNAIILAGIEIPKERECDFNRVKLTDKEMLALLKYHTELRFENGADYLMTMKELDAIKNMPTQSTYYSRFNNQEEMYSLIGYDYHNFNNSVTRKFMIEKYQEICEILGKVPDSRDIERFSREKTGYYSMSSYEFHFGSLYKLQVACDYTPTKIGRNKSRQDLINDLLWLEQELKRTPIMIDLCKYETIASSGKYHDVFGGFHNALKEAGLNPNNRVYYSKKGTKCLSYYELKITNWLEDSNVSFKKEVPYRKVIKSDETLRRFDWVIKDNKNTYYVEMFGIVGLVGYDLKTENKTKICEDNNLNLISIFPNDMKRSLDDIFSFLFAENKKVV